MIYHVISAMQFDRSKLDDLFEEVRDMEGIVRKGRSTLLSGEIMACLFFEPSTRTRFSFESAMHRLGGRVISTDNASQFSSAIKGETLEDTIRVVASYVDVIVIRHNEIGSASRAAAVANVPILNAGDGAGEHPTQALLDIYTIYRELGNVEGITIAMIGDLAYGRTVHSLSYLLANYRDVRILFTGPPETPIPASITDYLTEKGVRFEYEPDLASAAKRADILYQTRVQKERFPSPEQYEKVRGLYLIDQEIVDLMQPHARILHPLPRAGEIAIAVDEDPKAAYFRQAENGVYVRMALLERCLRTN
ncbi:MAG: pyrB [Bacilli bacterium]|nr:pyrB [Bacilli bacterium]